MLDEYRLAVKFIEKALTNHNINGITFCKLLPKTYTKFNNFYTVSK